MNRFKFLRGQVTAKVVKALLSAVIYGNTNLTQQTTMQESLHLVFFCFLDYTLKELGAPKANVIELSTADPQISACLNVLEYAQLLRRRFIMCEMSCITSGCLEFL